MLIIIAIVVKAHKNPNDSCHKIVNNYAMIIMKQPDKSTS